MPSAPAVFSQIVSRIYRSEFVRCVEQFPMRRSSRSFSAYDHFLCLCFGQLTFRDSARDIIACLQARPYLQYHLGFRGRLTRTNFAYANEYRDWRVFAALADVLIRRAKRLYQHASSPDWPHVVFALDASIIHLSLKLFPWSYWARSQSGALKLHTLLALKGGIPAWTAITEATVPDLKLLDKIPIEPGAFYVMDRGYLDFTRLVRLQREGAWFVVRNKQHVRFAVLQSRPVDKATGLRCDQTIALTSPWSRRHYSHPLRRISFRDPQENLWLVLLTNNFDIAPEVVAQLYKQRWQVELFFKWIKQHLRIKNFFGRSHNAIHSQIWSAICTYLLVAIAKQELRLEKSLYEILQILSVTAFEQVPLDTLLAQSSPLRDSPNPTKTPSLLGF
jgi:hypothetical protein